MTLGNLLSASAERNPRRAAIRPVEALDYDFNLSKLERVMSRGG
jgi:hypothetical protein